MLVSSDSKSIRTSPVLSNFNLIIKLCKYEFRIEAQSNNSYLDLSRDTKRLGILVSELRKEEKIEIRRYIKE